MQNLSFNLQRLDIKFPLPTEAANPRLCGLIFVQASHGILAVLQIGRALLQYVSKASWTDEL